MKMDKIGNFNTKSQVYFTKYTSRNIYDAVPRTCAPKHCLTISPNANKFSQEHVMHGITERNFETIENIYRKIIIIKDIPMFYIPDVHGYIVAHLIYLTSLES